MKSRAILHFSFEFSLFRLLAFQQPASSPATWVPDLHRPVVAGRCQPAAVGLKSSPHTPPVLGEETTFCPTRRSTHPPCGRATRLRGVCRPGERKGQHPLWVPAQQVHRGARRAPRRARINGSPSHTAAVPAEDDAMQRRSAPEDRERARRLSLVNRRAASSVPMATRRRRG